MADRDQGDGNGNGREDGRKEGPSLFDLPLDPEPRGGPRRKPRDPSRDRSPRRPEGEEDPPRRNREAEPGERSGGPPVPPPDPERGRTGQAGTGGDESGRGRTGQARTGQARTGPSDAEAAPGDRERSRRPRRQRPELPLFGEEDASPAPPDARREEPDPPPPGGTAGGPEPVGDLRTDDRQTDDRQTDDRQADATETTDPERFDDERLDLGTGPRPEPPVAPAAPRRPRPAPFLHRLGASLLDGGLLLVASASAIVGSFLLGVRWDQEDLPALGLFLLVFSFAYSVVPLAFWGRTPGMALTGIVSRGADGGPLTFGQTAVRWLAGLLTLALGGLPLLLALGPLGARSLADRLSGSRTWLPPDS